MNNTRDILNVIVLCATLGAGGCKTTDVVFRTGSAVAQVDVPYKGDVAAITCLASTDQHCFNGIGHLRNRDWQKAVDELTQAVAKNTKDDKAHFALGVAYEMLEDLDKAMEHYKAANFVKNQPDYMRAVDRVETKLKQKAGQ